MLRSSRLFFNSETAGQHSRSFKKTSHPRIFTMDAVATKPTRGVCAMIGWLYCQPKTLRRYAEIYSDNGIDTVFVTCDWTHVMRPDQGRQLVKDLETEINCRHLKAAVAQNARSDEVEKNLCLHSFSMGAYMTSLWMEQMRAAESPMLKQFRSQYYDSPVDYAQVPRGISQATFKNKTAAAMLEASIENMLKTFPKVRKEHIAASDRFWNEPLNAPSLWFYSAEDVISSEDTCEKVMTNWKQKANIEVEGIKFKGTKHVCHLKHHPDLYRNSLEAHLNKYMPSK